MIIHREGYKMIAIITLILLALNVAIYNWVPGIFIFLLFISLVFWGLVVQFFRNPSRKIAQLDNQLVYAPADGKVVVIEEVEEPEYFHEKKLQISIFMSPLNVHVNRNPVGGKVSYYKYHPGKYMVAWHPKSSTENERTTVVIDGGQTKILIRQIAGAVARRIRNYLQIDQQVEQGSEMGFIKFGSRVDVFLPLNAEVLVKVEEKVKGNLTVLAALRS